MIVFDIHKVYHIEQGLVNWGSWANKMVFILLKGYKRKRNKTKTKAKNKSQKIKILKPRLLDINYRSHQFISHGILADFPIHASIGISTT